MRKKTIVMKFGGTAVSSPESFSRVADIIVSRMEQYQRVAVVVSAMGNTTNDLFSLAYRVNPSPPIRELDMLVSVGERISISLLAMALSCKGREAVSFTGSQSGIITCSRHNEARIVDVKPRRLFPYLDSRKVVIVAGFQGVSLNGEITTLGRGGSDTTAVALAVALDAEKVEFFKDVPGIFNRDPKVEKEARLLPRLSYDEALEIVEDGEQVLHKRCVSLAKKNNLPLYVRSFQDFAIDIGTVISGKYNIAKKYAIYEDE